MKTLSTLLLSILIVGTINAKDITTTVEITNTNVVSSTTLHTGASESTVVLTWSAKSEMSNVRYEIERSFYANNFTAIAKMVIPFNNGNINNYSINDKAAELAGRTIVYYRVKQIAADGTITYSNVKVVNLKSGNSVVKVKPAAAISFSAPQNGKAFIQVKTMSGEVIKTINTIAGKGSNNIELNSSNDIAKGMYVTEVSVNGELIETKKLIIE